MTQTKTSPEHQELETMLRDSAADFCARALKRERLRALRGAAPAYDRALWRQMAELGWTEILVPATQGGLGLGVTAIAVVSRKLGSVIAPEPLLETAVAAVSVLCSLGDPSPCLPALTAGTHVIVPALGQVGGDAFAALHATAVDQSHTLDGTVTALPLGPDADQWLLPATLAGQPAWFLVSAQAPGAHCVSRELADGSRDGHLTLTACAAQLLGHGEPARAALALARTRVEIASGAYLLGLAETLFAMTLDYVGTRRQFGQAIGSFQVLQHRLVDLYIGLRLTDAVLSESCATIAEGADAQTAASRLRYRACETTLAVIREAVQMHGAMGYTDECDVGLYLNRALVVITRYGNAREHVAALSGNGTLLAGSAQGAVLPTVNINCATPSDGWNSLDNDTFRAIVRGWHETHYPSALRNPRSRPRWTQCRDWYATLYARGWAAPGWPAEHGWMGLSPDKLLIFIEERERWGVARTPDQGIVMVGPVLMQHGTPTQLAQYLPKALSGEHIWCQGYSEPNAGSDLASLRTSAVREGDEFVINGQKIWTTMAQDATHMFCLVRTDPQAKPQRGISFVLIDFKSPGITVRPIRNISGDSEFCEVFLDNVRIPVDSVVGALHDGWTIAKALLGFERLFIGSPKYGQYALNRLRSLAAARGLLADPVFVDKLTRFTLDVADLEALYKVFADVVKRGETLGADVSTLKIWASETFARLSEFLIESAGQMGAQVGDIAFGDTTVDVMTQYWNARPTTIYGGSNEIQRNIIAKQVLRLPAN